MDLVRCFHCQGSGKIMGGGMIYHECDECNGKGKVNAPRHRDDSVSVNNSNNLNNNISVKPRRGRPKKDT